MERSREEQVIELCQKLINEKSYSGHEDGVVRVLSESYKSIVWDGKYQRK